MATSLRERTLGALGSVIGGLAVVGFLTIGLRSCVTTVWLSGDEVRSYSVVGEDQRALLAVILPQNKVVLWYLDSAKNYQEIALMRWRGTEGKKYPFGVWHFPDAPMRGANLRRVAAGYTPYFMDLEILEKYLEGNDAPWFPEKGSSTRSVILLADNDSSLVFEGMPLRRDSLDPATAANLIALFDDPDVRSALHAIAAGRNGMDEDG